MTRPSFEQVTAAWDAADVDAIHPLRRENEDAYWSSGVAQASDAAKWIPAGGTVVDFGCGEGRLTLPLVRSGFRVIAVDASLSMLHRLRQHTGGMCQSVQSNGLNLPDLIEPVDVIVARAVLIHHSHADVAKLVEAFSRSLKPGGYLIADWPTGRHHERTDWIDVTTWEPAHRLVVGETAGLELVVDDTPTVWRKL